MKLFLQFGHGMKTLTMELSKRWDGVSVILSPRDMTPSQLISWSQDFEKNGVECYFDPQCYCPKSEQKRLIQYEYWDSRMSTRLQNGDSFIEEQIRNIKEYSDIAKVKAYLLPSILHDYNQDWHHKFIDETKKTVEAGHKYFSGKPVYATLALPSEFLIQNENTIEPVLQEILDLEVDGYYIIAEAIDRKYLIDSPMWISNVLHISAAMKLAGKTVIYGYGNHQMLALSLTGIDAMASGTWLNVRSFTNRFIDLDDQKRRSTWVYYPEALSEYKLAFLDWAYQTGCLDSMKSRDALYLDSEIQKLFQGNIPPSNALFTETDAFKHYLNCLRHQIDLLNKDTFKEAYESYEILLMTAEREIERLERRGVFAQTRSFKNFIDVNRAAVTQLYRSHGFALSMAWDSIKGISK